MFQTREIYHVIFTSYTSEEYADVFFFILFWMKINLMLLKKINIFHRKVRDLKLADFAGR